MKEHLEVMYRGTEPSLKTEKKIRRQLFDRNKSLSKIFELFCSEARKNKVYSLWPQMLQKISIVRKVSWKRPLFYFSEVD